MKRCPNCHGPMGSHGYYEPPELPDPHAALVRIKLMAESHSAGFTSKADLERVMREIASVAKKHVRS